MNTQLLINALCEGNLQYIKDNEEDIKNKENFDLNHLKIPIEFKKIIKNNHPDRQTLKKDELFCLLLDVYPTSEKKDIFEYFLNQKLYSDCLYISNKIVTHSMDITFYFDSLDINEENKSGHNFLFNLVNCKKWSEIPISTFMDNIDFVIKHSKRFDFHKKNRKGEHFLEYFCRIYLNDESDNDFSDYMSQLASFLNALIVNNVYQEESLKIFNTTILKSSIKEFLPVIEYMPLEKLIFLDRLPNSIISTFEKIIELTKSNKAKNNTLLYHYLEANGFDYIDPVNGKNALHHMAEHGLSTTMDNLLYFKDVDINLQDKYGFTPLHSLVIYFNSHYREGGNLFNHCMLSSIILLLQKEKLNLTLVNINNETAMDLVKNKEDSPLLPLFIKKERELLINTVNEKKTTINNSQRL